MNPKQHWDAVYDTKSVKEVSWFQREAAVSLDLITRFSPNPENVIVDAGGGASTLADGLLSRGYRRILVLDLARAALEAARRRLGTAASNLRWVVGDVLRHPFAGHSVDVWHDRAVFHFLTSDRDRRTYAAQVLHTVRPGGCVIMATFSEDGPKRCSGLDVCRYAPEGLRAALGPAFELLAHTREEHVTPGGATQRFQYSVFSTNPSRRAQA